ncbi:MAG: hypothetical protein HQ512_05605 [Rhodospirillales bacterium]|nr:hypothetical protein [Rhodospirillales bacterium]
MKDFYQLIESFGFPKNDSAVLAMVCLLILLGNFTGGLLSNILVAQGGAIQERKLTARTSFRLAVFSESVFALYIAYYHGVTTTALTTAQIIFWGFNLLAAPLLAALGAQLSYIAFAKKIEGLKKEYRDWERGVSDQEKAGGNEDSDDD